MRVLGLRVGVRGRRAGRWVVDAARSTSSSGLGRCTRSSSGADGRAARLEDVAVSAPLRRRRASCRRRRAPPASPLPGDGEHLARRASITGWPPANAIERRGAGERDAERLASDRAVASDADAGEAPRPAADDDPLEGGAGSSTSSSTTREVAGARRSSAPRRPRRRRRRRTVVAVSKARMSFALESSRAGGSRRRAHRVTRRARTGASRPRAPATRRRQLSHRSTAPGRPTPPVEVRESGTGRDASTGTGRVVAVADRERRARHRPGSRRGRGTAPRTKTSSSRRRARRRP
jgi:hypothetical protein